MDYLKKIPVIASVVMLVIAGGFCVYYFVASIHNNSPSSINTPEINAVKEELKNQHQSVEEISTYYRFSRVNFDLKLKDNVSSEEINEIAGDTRKLILLEGLNKKLSYKDNPSLRIHLILNSGEDVYEFEGNKDENEYYEIWHFRKNGGDETEVVFNE